MALQPMLHSSIALIAPAHRERLFSERHARISLYPSHDFTNWDLVMASEARIAANGLNAQKSTGPRTAEGKARSSQNARKHGMRSEREKLMREDSLAFEERLRRWSANTQPENDVEEFLLYENVAMTASLDRVRRAHAEHVQTRTENDEAGALEAAHDLGNRLFFDPCGPTAVYGSQPSNWRKHRTSWSGEAKEPDEPAKLVRALRSSAAGCRWMRDRWKELRAFLEQPKGFLTSSDRLKAVRLLGRHPIHAQDDGRVAEIFAATYALRPSGGGAFDDLRTDMGLEMHEKFVKTIKARWPELPGTGKADKARQVLLDLVDENIARIESRLKKHLKNPEKKAGRSIDRLGVDKSRDGEFFFKYELRFSNAAKRGVYDLQKYQEKRKKNGRQRERDDVARFEPAVPRRAPRGAGGILGRAVDKEPEPDLSWLPESGEVTPTLPSPMKGEGVEVTPTLPSPMKGEGVEVTPTL